MGGNQGWLPVGREPTGPRDLLGAESALPYSLPSLEVGRGVSRGRGLRSLVWAQKSSGDVTGLWGRADSEMLLSSTFLPRHRWAWLNEPQKHFLDSDKALPTWLLIINTHFFHFRYF